MGSTLSRRNKEQGWNVPTFRRESVRGSYLAWQTIWDDLDRLGHYLLRIHDSREAGEVREGGNIELKIYRS